MRLANKATVQCWLFIGFLVFSFQVKTQITLLKESPDSEVIVIPADFPTQAVGKSSVMIYLIIIGSDILESTEITLTGQMSGIVPQTNFLFSGSSPFIDLYRTTNHLDGNFRKGQQIASTVMSWAEFDGVRARLEGDSAYNSVFPFETIPFVMDPGLSFLVQSLGLDLVKIEKKDKQAEGMEWCEFYSKFVNLSITFNKCVGHIGEYEWCRSVSFDDFQIRVYVLQNEIKYLKEKILDTLATMEKIPLNRYLSSKDKLIIIKEPKISFSYTDDQKAWNCLQITANLHYYDYQGTSKIDYYWKKIKNAWIVFVFMYNKTEDHAKNLAFILDSVKFN